MNPDKLDTTFGTAWFAPPLFYKYETALRFELGSGQHPLDRFLSAYERAAAITSHLLGNADDLTLAIVFWTDTDKPCASELFRLWRALRTCGLPAPDRQSLGFLRIKEHGESTGILRMTMTIGEEHIRRALWAAIAHDLGVQPNMPALIFLASISLGVLLHPYDDRGLDAVGTSVDSIRSAYEQFHDWLLTDDLARMIRTFGD